MRGAVRAQRKLREPKIGQQRSSLCRAMFALSVASNSDKIVIARGQGALALCAVLLEGMCLDNHAETARYDDTASVQGHLWSSGYDVSLTR